jgi:hypothetical protein
MCCHSLRRNAEDSGNGFIEMEDNRAALCNVGVMSW